MKHFNMIAKTVGAQTTSFEYDYRNQLVKTTYRMQQQMSLNTMMANAMRRLTQAGQRGMFIVRGIC